MAIPIKNVETVLVDLFCMESHFINAAFYVKKVFIIRNLREKIKKAFKFHQLFAMNVF